MINWLTAHPGVLMFGNCCFIPVVLFGIGVFVGRFRPKLRVPFTLADDDSLDERY